MSTADLIIDANGPDIRHRTGLTAPDAFFCLKQDNGPVTVLFDAREYGVQQERLSTLNNGVVLERLEPYIETARAMTEPLTIPQRTLLAALKAKGIGAVRVPPEIHYGWVKAMLDAGIRVDIKDFARERRYKTETQLGLMIEAQRVTEGAYDLAKNILAESVIDGNRLTYRGETLTSEKLRAILKQYFLERGYSNPHGLVIASGEQGARPHDEGSGPILPNTFIVIDIFPQSDTNGFYADMTRTFVKGAATEEMKRIYEAVREVQQEMVDLAEVGMRCDHLYEATVEAFRKRGFETSPEKGFMHRTGHGLGLSVHEEPSFLTGFPDVLEPGMVMSVEPGLYYPGIGGVRIEDIICFHDDGRKENINRYSKDYLIP